MEDPQFHRSNRTHAIFRATAHYFGALAPNNFDDVKNGLEYWKTAHDIILQFGDKDTPTNKRNKFAFTIPNSIIPETNATLGELLFSLSKASDSLLGREQHAHTLLTNNLGVASSIVRKMSIVYRHIHAALQTSGIKSETAHEMMCESGLDIPKNIALAIIQENAEKGVRGVP